MQWLEVVEAGRGAHEEYGEHLVVVLVCDPEWLSCIAGAMICRRLLSAYIYGYIMVTCGRLCMHVGQLLAGRAEVAAGTICC